MPHNNSHFEKHHKIAVIGAGPAGIHMASLLKKKGYHNVTVLEKTDRIGGKSYTQFRDGVPYELGTCFMHNGYHLIQDLVKNYGLQAGISPGSAAIFLDNPSKQLTSITFNEFVAQAICKTWRQRLPKWKWLSIGMIQISFFKSIWRYIQLYRQLFGTWKLPYGIPLYLSPDVLRQIDMTFLAFLKKHQLGDLINLLQIAQTAQGYGYLERIPAYYGLCWITPELLIDLIKQIIRLTDNVIKMLPDGFETLWQTIAEQDNLSVKLNTTVHSICRQQNDQTNTQTITIEYTDKQKTRQLETYDFLILTTNLRQGLRLFKDATATEERLLSALEGCTLTVTLYESDPIQGYSTMDDDRATAYLPDVLSSARDNEWFADRNDRNIFANVRGVEKSFDRQVRLAYQFSGEEQEGVYCDNSLFSQNADIASQLKSSWTQRGLKNPKIIEQFSWLYFMHFPDWAIRQGYTNQLWEYQGQQNIWYAGASACFESVNNVVNYNHALVETYL